MARACNSLSEKRASKRSIASCVLADERIIAIVSSILSTAISKPSRICSLSCALRKSKRVRRSTTSSRCFTKSSISLYRLSSSGLPFTRAMLLVLKLLWRAVFLKRWLSTTLALASRLISITTRIPPFPLDSSEMLLMPSRRLLLTISAIRPTISALFTWYGISVTIIRSPPLGVCSISVRARSTMRPRPVR